MCPPTGGVFQDALSAGFDAASHLKDMDREGVDVGVLLPTRGMYVIWADHIDTDLSAALCRAYNNWLHSYCAADSRRLKGVALIPLQGTEEAKAELRRAVLELGFVGAYMRPNPLLKRKLHDSAYDGLYAEAESLGVPILLHEGWGSVLHQLGEDRQDTIFGLEGVLDPFEMMLAVMSFMGHNVLERFPDLKVGFPGLRGWLDSLLAGPGGRALGRALRHRGQQHRSAQHPVQETGIRLRGTRRAHHTRSGRRGRRPLPGLGQPVPPSRADRFPQRAGRFCG